MLALRLRHILLWLAIIAASIACCCQLQLESSSDDGHRHSSKRHHKSELKRNKILKKAIGKLLRSGVHYYSPDQLRDFKYFLSSISIPRSVNSKGHQHVRKFIKSTIGSLSRHWHVEEDSFATGTGEGGKVHFRNIVATYIPTSYLCSGVMGNETFSGDKQQQRIVLSCHYDSLHPSLVHGSGSGDYSRNGRGSLSKSRRQFVGATDAAVSCSILLSLAQYITPYLALVTKHKHKHKPPPTVQLIFFDGEEALLEGENDHNYHRARSLRSSVSSSSKNALYGSRHLAREWERAAESVQNTTDSQTSTTTKKKSSKRKRSRQISETSSAFKSAARLAATAVQLCKSPSSAGANIRQHQQRYNYRSTRSENSGNSDDDKSANEVVPRGGDEDAVGDGDEVIDSVVSSRRLAMVTAALDSEGNHHQSAAAGHKNIGQLASIEKATRLLAGNYHSLANIRLLLLLDLIGGPQAPRFFNTNLLTNKYFRQLAEIEKHLLASTSRSKSNDVDEEEENLSQRKKSFRKPFFQTNPPFVLSLVRDDHLPFVVRNVPVVHLIPSPFPRNWHTAEDNLRSLNFDAIGRITRVLQIFLLHSLKV